MIGDFSRFFIFVSHSVMFCFCVQDSSDSFSYSAVLTE